MRVDSQELLSAVPFFSCFHVILGLPGPHFPSTCMSKAVLTAPLEHYTCPPAEPSPEGGLDPQCQAAQVDHWTWWWKYLAAWHCRSVWSLPCHSSSADCGGLALSVAKSYWHGALCSIYKSCTCGHVSWKRGGGKRELVAAPWISSRRFSHLLWLKVHSHRLLRACLLGRKRKLPPPAWQVWLGLPIVVCGPRSMQFPGTMYICNQGPLSSAWAHCISCAPSACSHCRRCCHCPLCQLLPERKEYYHQFSLSSICNGRDQAKRQSSRWEGYLNKYFFFFIHENIMCNARKGPICSLQTMQAFISLHICAGWSRASLSADRINGYCSICKLSENAQIRLHGWEGSSRPPLFAYGLRA